MEQAAQVHGVLFKIANGQKLQLVVVAVVVAVLFAITPHQVALVLPLLPREFSSLGRFNNVRPFVSHKFAQQFTQCITVVHQVEPQPRIDPQLHTSEGERQLKTQGRAKTFASETIYFTFKLRNVSTFSSFWQMQMPKTLSSFAAPFRSLPLLLPLLLLRSLRRASLRLLLDLIRQRDLPVVFMHVIYCSHSHKDVFIMRFSAPAPPTHSPRRFSSQANRYQQFGIVWKLICK